MKSPRRQRSSSVSDQITDSPRFSIRTPEYNGAHQPVMLGQPYFFCRATPDSSFGVSECDWPHSSIRSPRACARWRVSARVFSFVPTKGFAEKFRGAAEIHFLFHSRAINLDGFYADPKCLGDLACAKALAQHFEYFQFAVAELLDRGTAGQFLAFYQASSHDIRDSVADVHFPLQDP